jgi:hypothetical protein
MKTRVNKRKMKIKRVEICMKDKFDANIGGKNE